MDTMTSDVVGQSCHCDKEIIMRKIRTVFVALVMAGVLSSRANAQQKAEAKPGGVTTSQGARVCALENGVNVCRDSGPARAGERESVDLKAGGAAASEESTKPGRLLLLLDIPSNVFSRLAGDPENNRKFHAKAVQEYRPAAPAPPGAGKYVSGSGTEAPVWKYNPKSSFEYQPKGDRTYNRDVYGRLWQQNIAHDTRVVELPVDAPGVYLMPVADVR